MSRLRQVMRQVFCGVTDIPDVPLPIMYFGFKIEFYRHYSCGGLLMHFATHYDML